MLEVSFTAFANTTADTIWHLWSDLDNWSSWDTGIEWCKFIEESSFEVGGKAMLLPKGAPNPVTLEIVVCEENKCFIDEAQTDLGLIKLTHFIEAQNNGVFITHTMQVFPHNEQCKSIIEQNLFPKMQKELPNSVKALIKLAESLCINV